MSYQLNPLLEANAAVLVRKTNPQVLNAKMQMVINKIRKVSPDNYAKKYHLADAWNAYLKKLGFKVGDNPYHIWMH